MFWNIFILVRNIFTQHTILLQEVDYECLELSTDPPHLLVALVCEAAGDTEDTGATDNVI